MEFKIYIYMKPWSEDQIIYKTFDAAERACRQDGLIEEWTCSASSDRFALTNSWQRIGKEMVRQFDGTAAPLEFEE